MDSLQEYARTEMYCQPPPEMVPLPHDHEIEGTGTSSLSLSIVDGPALSLWTAGTVQEGKTQTELRLQLEPNRSVVIGRQEGGQIEYLDPCYQPTRILPASGQAVVASGWDLNDRRVSRGHFMLKGALSGIVLVNGVPRRGGGIRPPLNGTLLLAPGQRHLEHGEEYLISRGAAATIRLPNGTVILLQAE